ncbi:hypothetical protein MZA96_09950 [Haemophilus influenzae]
MTTKSKHAFLMAQNWSEWKDAGGDGVPLGAVVSFPRAVTNPVGFLKADGTTFNQTNLSRFIPHFGRQQPTS